MRNSREAILAICSHCRDYGLLTAHYPRDTQIITDTPEVKVGKSVSGGSLDLAISGSVSGCFGGLCRKERRPPQSLSNAISWGEKLSRDLLVKQCALYLGGEKREGGREKRTDAIVQVDFCEWLPSRWSKSSVRGVCARARVLLFSLAHFTDARDVKCHFREKKMERKR